MNLGLQVEGDGNKMFWKVRYIILLQCIIAMLCWGYMWFFRPFSEPILSRLEKLPTDTHQKIAKELQETISKQQLLVEDEPKVIAEIQKLGTALKWELLGEISVYPRISEDGIIPVDMKWKIEGDFLFLPLYLEGLRRLSAQGLLEKMVMQFHRKTVDIQLRFMRADAHIPNWINQEKTLNEKNKALLRQGWMLQYWKDFRNTERERKEQLDWTIFAVELSRQITLFRSQEKTLYWSVQEGFTEKSF